MFYDESSFMNIITKKVAGFESNDATPTSEGSSLYY
jgi:hypothetical protein